MKMYLLGAVFLAFVAMAVATPTISEASESAMEHIMEKMKGPNKFIRPPGDTTNVTINMYVRNIFAMDETTRRWKVQLTFRQEWEDSRLAFTTENTAMTRVAYGNPKDIWTPDLFIREEIESHTHDNFHPNTLLYIYPDGKVLFSQRITVELYCPVDFHMKNFVCPLGVASYMHTKEELDIHWKVENPVQLPKMVSVPNYTLNGVTTQTCDSKTLIGKWSCVTALFNFGHGVCQA